MALTELRAHFRSLVVAGILSLVFSAPAAVAHEAPTSCQVSQTAVRQATERARDKIEEYEQKIRAEHGPAPNHGFSVAVSMCGKTVWSAAFGFADLESMIPATTETKFRIGSVSKTLTSVALGKLVEGGKLDLDAEVQTYVPDFPHKAYPITTRELAGHLAGIREYQGDEFFSATNYKTVRDSLSIFENDPLVHKPGSAYLYSSYGWNLLSAVIEGASGEDFLTFMQESVFDPAGMSRTTADKNAEIIPNRTRFYHFADDDTRPINAPYVDNSNKWSGGGFLSTPEDLLKFGQAVTDGRLLDSGTFRVLTTSQETDADELTNYGMGWATDMLGRQAEHAGAIYSPEEIARARAIIGDAPVIGHTGGSVGGLTAFLMLPDAPGEVIVAAVSNNSGLEPVFALMTAAEFVAAAKEEQDIP